MSDRISVFSTCISKTSFEQRLFRTFAASSYRQWYSDCLQHPGGSCDSLQGKMTPWVLNNPSLKYLADWCTLFCCSDSILHNWCCRSVCETKIKSLFQEMNSWLLLIFFLKMQNCGFISARLAGSADRRQGHDESKSTYREERVKKSTSIEAESVRTGYWRNAPTQGLLLFPWKKPYIFMTSLEDLLEDHGADCDK